MGRSTKFRMPCSAGLRNLLSQRCLRCDSDRGRFGECNHHAGLGAAPACCVWGAQAKVTSLTEISFFLGLIEMVSSFSEAGSEVELNCAISDSSCTLSSCC